MRKLLIAALVLSGAAFAQIGGRGGIGPTAGGSSLPTLSNDQSTPGTPTAGKTFAYTKSGKLCSFSTAGEFCTGSPSSAPAVNLQPTSPGTPQTGNINISGTALLGGSPALTDPIVTAGTAGVTAGHLVSKTTDDPVKYVNSTSTIITIKGIAATTALSGSTFVLQQQGQHVVVVEGTAIAGHYWGHGVSDPSAALDLGTASLSAICNSTPVGGVFQAGGTGSVLASMDWNLHGGMICSSDLGTMMVGYRTGLQISYTDADTLSISAGSILFLGGSVYQSATSQSVTFAALDTGTRTLGTDYYVFATTGGIALSAITVSGGATAPTGYTTSNSQLLGYFHNGKSINNANALGAIFQYSITNNSLIDFAHPYRAVQDLPQGIPLPGMVRVGSVAYGIYKASHEDATASAAGSSAYPTSRYGVVPWASLSGWDTMQVLAQAGLRLPTWAEWLMAVEYNPGSATSARLNGNTDYGASSDDAELGVAGAPTVATGAAGVLTGAYQYLVTLTNAVGETYKGTASVVVNPSSQQVAVSAIPKGAATGGIATGQTYVSGSSSCTAGTQTVTFTNGGGTLASGTITVSGGVPAGAVTILAAGAGYTSVPTTATISTCTGTATLSGGALTVATGRKLYRTKAGGATYYLLATIADNSTTTYTDNTADGSLSATTAPGYNTTGAQAAVNDPTCNCGRSLLGTGPRTANNGSTSTGRSWYSPAGLADPVGNVWEWVAQFFGGLLTSGPGAYVSWGFEYDGAWSFSGQSYNPDTGGFTSGLPSLLLVGGSWLIGPLAGVRAANAGNSPGVVSSSVGFRPAR